MTMTGPLLNSKLYLPPAAVTKIRPTDAYVIRTSVYYHAQSERLLTVGHPYYPIKKSPDVDVPKVSPHQYRVFRVKLPDPNRLALTDKTLFNPDKERLVWACRGIEVGRGQPLGVSLSGHPLFNRFADTENSAKYIDSKGRDNRQNISFDCKQTQLLMVGCRPAIGEYWDKVDGCKPPPAGACPALELQNAYIQDGDMGDIGFGAMNFSSLQVSKSDVPLDLVDSISKYPDFLKMANDSYGDNSFFHIRREQMYQRHFFSRPGNMGEPIPEGLYVKAALGEQQHNNFAKASSVYFGTPSGSLVTSEAQIFNRPYWLQRAQGPNNGIAWHEQLFITVLDNTRGTNFTVTVSTAEPQNPEQYSEDNYNVYSRHVEEYEVSMILQLCKVPLIPEVLTHIHTMDPRILDNWNLGVNPPAATLLEDQYRFLSSSATKCPVPAEKEPDPDPYAQFTFWQLDFTERISPELDQFPLGRKFLLQSGSLKRPRPVKTSPSTSKSRPPKRRRK
ncbi:L1 [Trichechus manatus latirostris papillomavirus 4]|uniref:Major capsid protein L1 n=1 Tax=Trichechus manatus latirostris papillomavirus 4 TaxID=2848317 RepID=V5TGU8_9PAPI|nr:L1 [Trichechus manatus latirostris papillomavirus 4]AHB63945.1 major capsid protein [Trichechus manatus latirostris papillomavirus 4]AKE50907.1 L1 [Trichechus manatus latirostris papillomavirus 4]